MRGSNICLYVTRDASQGQDIYLREKRYLDQKKDSAKAAHHLEARVGWQESSPQNNFRRVIAAPISAGSFCNHKINYIPESCSSLPLDLVLALLNSTILDWFFRLISSSAAVSHYQIMMLPVPRLGEPGLPESIVDGICGLSSRLQKLEGARVLSSRSERSRLADASQELFDRIDEMLFQAYELSDEEARYVGVRRREMM